MSKRQFVIGDIHGELTALKALLASLNLQKNDEVIFLGDLIDKGLRSAETIDFLIKFKKEHSCIFVRGNHEEMMLASYEGNKRAEEIWKRHGGQAFLDSYQAYSIEDLKTKMPTSHLEFLRNTVSAHITKNHVFVHASWDTTKSAKNQTAGTLRYTFMNAVTPDKSFGKTIVCGHSSLVGGKPARKGNILCIDTIEYGWLTAYNLTDGGFVQSSKAGRIRHVEKEDVFSQDKHVPMRFRK